MFKVWSCHGIWLRLRCRNACHAKPDGKGRVQFLEVLGRTWTGRTEEDGHQGSSFLCFMRATNADHLPYRWFSPPYPCCCPFSTQRGSCFRAGKRRRSCSGLWRAASRQRRRRTHEKCSLVACSCLFFGNAWISCFSFRERHLNVNSYICWFIVVVVKHKKGLFCWLIDNFSSRTVRRIIFNKIYLYLLFMNEEQECYSIFHLRFAFTSKCKAVLPRVNQVEMRIVDCGNFWIFEITNAFFIMLETAVCYIVVNLCHGGYCEAPSPWTIYGQGHMVLNLENEVGPPVQLEKTNLILTKITVSMKRSSYSSMYMEIHLGFLRIHLVLCPIRV